MKKARTDDGEKRVFTTVKKKKPKKYVLKNKTRLLLHTIHKNKPKVS